MGGDAEAQSMYRRAIGSNEGDDVEQRDKRQTENRDVPRSCFPELLPPQDLARALQPSRYATFPTISDVDRK